MKTHSDRFRVEAEHLDAGDHANWLVQLAIAERFQFEFRDRLGFGLRTLKDEHDLFLVMRRVHDVDYRSQLLIDDEITAEISVWVQGRVSLGFSCEFRKDETIVTTMKWLMPIISLASNRPVRIPSWMADIIGSDVPHPDRTE